MQNSGVVSSTIVVDANVAIWALVPTVAPVDTLDRFVAWRRAGAEIVAPSLWLAECTSAFRRLVHAGLITPLEGRIAIGDLANMDVRTIPLSHAHCRTAFDWAEQLGQSRAYDGFYLAVADALEATLVTGDRRLANSGVQLGLSWVQWIGDHL